MIDSIEVNWSLSSLVEENDQCSDA